jgi:hypothetical protein
MSNHNRTPRDEETREVFTRPESWAPPELLPQPKQEPGWEYRYIRTALQGEDDYQNINRARREGWEPVQASEQPHIVAFSDKGAAHGNIEIGGLMLCKAPAEFVRQRNEYYRNMSRQAQQAVDQNLMKENDSRMPLFQERKTKVSFGSGG